MFDLDFTQQIFYRDMNQKLHGNSLYLITEKVFVAVVQGCQTFPSCGNFLHALTIVLISIPAKSSQVFLLMKRSLKSIHAQIIDITSLSVSLQGMKCFSSQLYFPLEEETFFAYLLSLSCLSFVFDTNFFEIVNY